MAGPERLLIDESFGPFTQRPLGAEARRGRARLPGVLPHHQRAGLAPASAPVVGAVSVPVLFAGGERQFGLLGNRALREQQAGDGRLDDFSEVATWNGSE